MARVFIKTEMFYELEGHQMDDEFLTHFKDVTTKEVEYLTYEPRIIKMKFVNKELGNE